MEQKIWMEAFFVLLFMIVATILISFTGADLKLSSYFYQSGGWPVGEHFPWKLLYYLEGYPALALAAFGLYAAYRGSIKPEWYSWRRQGVFLVLLLALGPGLLVNAVFKDHWGRPRPCEIVQFGGTQQFLQPWQPGIDGEGRSFPSGHSAAAFYLTAPFFVYRRSTAKLARKWLASGLGFGLLMGYARIAQGGHFLSDIVWAWGMVHLTALVLSAFLLSCQWNMVYSPHQAKLLEV